MSKLFVHSIFFIILRTLIKYTFKEYIYIQIYKYIYMSFPLVSEDNFNI